MIMWRGEVLYLYVAEEAAAPMRPVESVEAVAGRGLAGDRYFSKAGTFSKQEGTGRDVTLICIEEIEALARDYGTSIDPAETRRNIVTHGVPLNHLVGKTFQVGDVVLRGMRLCEPCNHLAKLTDQRVLRSMVHRGGLRCDIVTGGLLRVGDRVQEVARELA